MDFVLGMNCKVYYGTADAELAAMTELSIVKDATLSCEVGEADVTTRANTGWRATAATLRSLTAELTLVYKPGDAGYKALRDAWLAGTVVELAVLTGGRDAADTEGPKGNFSVTNFSRSESLEEGVTITATLKLAKFDEWVEVGSGS